MKRFAMVFLFIPMLAIAGQDRKPLPSYKGPDGNIRFFIGNQWQTAEPPKADPKRSDPAPPEITLSSIKERRAQMAKLLAQWGEMAKQDAADVAEFKRQAKELGIDVQIAPLQIGRRGPPGPPGPAGKDGHSPVVDFGTGADADRLTIDGVAKGPHLTGPAGPPGGGPAVDPFVKALQDAYTADVRTDKADSLAFLKTAYNLMASKQKAGLVTINDGLQWMRSVVETPKVNGVEDPTDQRLKSDQIVGVRKVIGTELSTTLGTKLADPLDGVRFSYELNKIATALQGVK